MIEKMRRTRGKNKDICARDLSGLDFTLIASLPIGYCVDKYGYRFVLASYFATFFDNQGPVVAIQVLNFLLVISLGMIYCLPDSLAQSRLVPKLVLAVSKNRDQ